VMRRMTGRGLGQLDYTPIGGYTPVDTSGEAVDVAEGGTYQPPPPAYQTYSTMPSTGWPTATGAGAGGSTWTNIINNLISTAGKAYQANVAPATLLPPGSTYVTSPYGTQVTTGGALNPAALTSQLSGLLPILLIGGAVVLVFMMANK